MSSLFEYRPHPHIHLRKEQGPVKLEDQHSAQGAYGKFNRWFAIKITAGVGSMTCAYLFAVLSLVSLPAVIASHSIIALVAWIAQTFFQLVLLSIILVGQNIMGEATDKRSEQTYNDAEAVLHEAQQIQQHLDVQDEKLTSIVSRLENRTLELTDKVTAGDIIEAKRRRP